MDTLPGLMAALSDEECDSIKLHGAGGAATVTFSRQGEDAWVPDDLQSDEVHTEDLALAIRNGFGAEWDRLECFLTGERLEYAIEGGSVRVQRRAVPTSGPGAESDEAGLKAVADALGIPRSKRKHKLRQARQFARIVAQALGETGKRTVRVLDLACGRSYLGFVLVHQLSAGGRKVQLHGVDSDPRLVQKCREIAAALGWANTTFEVADLSSHSTERGAYDIMVALHGCDTLTDEALRIGWEARIPLLFAAPCCQHELRHLWREHPLEWVSRYGLLEQRLADVLTDGFRCLVLEALGYRVKVLRFAAPDVTPKNLLIQAELTGDPDAARADAARAFLEQFGARPRLAAVLGAARPGPARSGPSHRSGA